MDQNQTPYVDALVEYARRSPARLHVPGHKGGQGADPGLIEAIGEQALRMDIPALTYGIDVGVDPTPFELAQRLAAEAWGARRAWFLINGASQGNLAAGLALAHRGDRRRGAAKRPLEHDRLARHVRACARRSSRPRSTPSSASPTA